MANSPLSPRPSGQGLSRQQMERIAEPWFINKAVTVSAGLLLAVILGFLVAQGNIEALIIVAVWLLATLTIVFVRDYWWSPALIVTALSLRTYAAGFALTGLEIGMVILALTIPIKMAMKTLRPAEPAMRPNLLYWVLVGFVALHCVVILFYSKIEGVPQLKNIVKAYYHALAPLFLYGMLIRFCKPKTVFRTGIILFFIWILTSISCIVAILTGSQLMLLTGLKINVDFLNALDAVVLLRGTGPALFISSVAFWPAARSGRLRFLLLGSGLLGIVGTLFSAGRAAVLFCFLAGAFFTIIRRRFWIAVPVVGVAGVVAILATADPDLLYHLPLQMQRALAPFNLSESKTEMQSGLGSSDEWHRDLREESLWYWMSDEKSFFLGHGFKSWDDTLYQADQVDVDTYKTFAIQMGLTENMFSAITNIFGLVGFLLYMAFLLQLAWKLWISRRLSPSGSPARAICEFSLVTLLSALLLSPMLGNTPGIELIFWEMGLLAARPYLAGTRKPMEVSTPAWEPRSLGSRPRQTFSAGA